MKCQIVTTCHLLKVTDSLLPIFPKHINRLAENKFRPRSDATECKDLCLQKLLPLYTCTS